MTASLQNGRIGSRGMKGVCWPFIGRRTEPLFSFSWLNYVALLSLIAVELKALMLLSKWWLMLYVLWGTDCGQRARGYDVKTPLQMFPEQRAKSTPLFLCQNLLLFGLVLTCLWKCASPRCVWRMAARSLAQGTYQKHLFTFSEPLNEESAHSPQKASLRWKILLLSLTI